MASQNTLLGTIRTLFGTVTSAADMFGTSVDLGKSYLTEFAESHENSRKIRDTERASDAVERIKAALERQQPALEAISKVDTYARFNDGKLEIVKNDFLQNPTSK